MPDDRAEFIKQAEECRRQAEGSKNRDHWLRIAQAWMVLAEATEPGAPISTKPQSVQPALLEQRA